MTMCEEEKKKTSHSADCRAGRAGTLAPATGLRQTRAGQTTGPMWVGYLISSCSTVVSTKRENPTSACRKSHRSFECETRMASVNPRCTRGAGSVQCRLVYCDIAADTPRRDIALLRVSSAVSAAKWQSDMAKLDVAECPPGRRPGWFGMRENIARLRVKSVAKEQGNACQNFHQHLDYTTYLYK